MNLAFKADKKGISKCPIQGIQTFTKGFAVFKDTTLLLTILFHPAGIFHIFNIRADELFDKIYESKDIPPIEAKTLQEQFHNIYRPSDCIEFVQLFLIKKRTTRKLIYKHEGILRASLFLNQNSPYCIKKLAYDCNMTVQTFETQFREQVGVNPNHCMCIKRFNSAVNSMLSNFRQSWTSIAYSCDHYDQNHLIKDFKEFTNFSPRSFMIQIHPPFENFE